jgi:hypothetical protein
MHLMTLTASSDYLQNNMIRLAFVMETQLSFRCMTLFLTYFIYLKNKTRIMRTLYCLSLYLSVPAHLSVCPSILF